MAGLRLKYSVLAFSSVVLLLLSTANCSLSVSVSVENPEIYKSESQTFTVTSNEGGIGVLLVFQPAEGAPWMDFLEDHLTLETLWNMLPNTTRAKIADKIGQKIVSFDIITLDVGGGNVTLTFPDDFVGINGDPGTEVAGEYKALLAFLSYQKPNSYDDCCCLFEVDFDCVSWPVVPEFTSGLFLIILFSTITLLILKTRRKFSLS